MSCISACFPDRFPLYALTAQSAHSLGQGCVRMFRCNLPPALSAEWPGSFICHCGMMRWNGLWISQHRQLTLRRKFSRPSCQDSDLQPFLIMSPVFCQWAIPAPMSLHYDDITTLHRKAMEVNKLANFVVLWQCHFTQRVCGARSAHPFGVLLLWWPSNSTQKSCGSCAWLTLCVSVLQWQCHITKTDCGS